MRGDVGVLLREYIDVKWNYKSKKHYESKGYAYTKIGEKLTILISDLMNGSNEYIYVLCDYCLEQNIKTISKIKYQDYFRKNINGVIHKDCCKRCQKIKLIESNLLTYGVESASKLEEFKQREIVKNREKYGADYYVETEEFKLKASETMLNKYGETSYSKTDEYRGKYKATSLRKFGTEHPWLNKDIREKTVNSFIQKYNVDNPMKIADIADKQRYIMYQNETAPCSNQQRHIYGLIGGELNFPIGNISLDIAFPDEMIYVEYDGSGHDLSARLGTETYEEFNKRNIRREWFLYRQGWKMVRVISLTDILPSDDKILEMINFSKEYLNTGHSWICFDIDNQIVKTSQFKQEYNYGELRKIKKSQVS